MSTQAPKYLNLIEIKMPIGAIVSILHRLTGLLLILAIPLIIWLFAISISNQAGFIFAKDMIASINLFNFVFIWSFCHHLLTGIRFLLLDFDIGISKSCLSLSSCILFVLSILIFLVLFFLAL